jgi:hypothetical protein
LFFCKIWRVVFFGCIDALHEKCILNMKRSWQYRTLHHTYGLRVFWSFLRLAVPVMDICIACGHSHCFVSPNKLW